MPAVKLVVSIYDLIHFIWPGLNSLLFVFKNTLGHPWFWTNDFNVTGEKQ